MRNKSIFHDINTVNLQSCELIEPTRIASIFNYSIITNKLCYTNYTGDGNLSVFNIIKQSKAHGDTKITKLECMRNLIEEPRYKVL